MPGYIYDINKEQLYTPEQSAWGTIAKLGGTMALQGSLFYMAESNLSLMGLSPLGLKINFDNPKLLGRLNKFTYEHMYSKIPTKWGWGKSLLLGTLKVAEIAGGASIPSVSGGKLDQGWMHFNNEVHTAYDYIGKSMGLTKYDTYEKLAELYKTMKDTDTLEIGKAKTVTKLEVKNILGLWKYSSIFSGAASLLEAWQTYQMMDMALTLGGAIGTLISNSYKNRENMKYYRRLLGISGSVSSLHQNEMSYSRLEEQLIMRAVNNLMVTRQIVNDLGVFGANPYQLIYG